jgi:photosystem II stability/assembly factor-like uncharacterized protein
MTMVGVHRKRSVCLCIAKLWAFVGLPARAALAWESIGPWGGAAELVRAVPGASGVVVAATRSGLVFVSRDGGTSWRETPSMPPATGVLHALALDPTDAATWYVGVEGRSPATSGLYRTTDAGRTWTLLADTQGMAVWSLASSPSDSEVMAAGTDSGVYVTRDEGATWKLVSPAGDQELRPVVSLAFDSHDSRILYAGTMHLPWRTVDGGATWQPVHRGMIDDSDVFSIAVDPHRPGRVLASACTGVYVSVDRGEHWARLATPAGAFRIYFVAFDPQDSRTIVAGTAAGLIKSADDGRTWRRVSTHVIKALTFDPFVPKRILFASIDAGLLVSGDDGDTLRESNVGFAHRTFTRLSGAGTAISVSGGSELSRAVAFDSFDAGRTWAPAAATRMPHAASGSATASACSPPAAAGAVYGTALDPANRDRALAATSRGLFRTVDGCRSWSVVAGGLEQATTTAVLFHPTRATEVLVVQAGWLFRSIDDGGTWQPLTGADLRLWPSSLLVLPGAPDRVYALVAGRGVFSQVIR